MFRRKNATGGSDLEDSRSCSFCRVQGISVATGPASATVIFLVFVESVEGPACCSWQFSPEICRTLDMGMTYNYLYSKGLRA